jgi:hypothetical protein
LKKTQINGKDIPRLWMGRIGIVKMSVLFKAIYRLNPIHIIILMILSIETKKKNPNSYETTKDTMQLNLTTTTTTKRKLKHAVAGFKASPLCRNQKRQT